MHTVKPISISLDMYILEVRHCILHSNACSFIPGVFSQVPVFVQIQHKWRRMYTGECQGPGCRTDFEMVHLRKVPSQYNHLSGLLDVFKSKIVSAVRSDMIWKKNYQEAFGNFE